MNNKWTSHLPDNKSKERFRNQITGSSEIFERMEGMLMDMLKASTNSTYDFTDPNWSHSCAHELGKQKAIQQVLDLLPTTQGK